MMNPLILKSVIFKGGMTVVLAGSLLVNGVTNLGNTVMDLMHKASIQEEILSEYLEVEIDEIKQGYNEHTFEIGNQEYIVVNEETRDELVEQEISESLWAFKPEFLEQVTDMPKEVFEKLSEKCESGNEAIEKVVDKTCGIKALVDEAIEWDGYGHFLGRYDGNEHEVKVGNKYWFVYRTN